MIPKIWSYLLHEMLEVLHEKTLGIVEFHGVCKNFLEVLHKVLIVVVLYEVGILYLQVHSNLLDFKSLHKVVRKLASKDCIAGISLTSYFLFYFALDIFVYIFICVYLSTI